MHLDVSRLACIITCHRFKYPYSQQVDILARVCFKINRISVYSSIKHWIMNAKSARKKETASLSFPLGKTCCQRLALWHKEARAELQDPGSGHSMFNIQYSMYIDSMSNNLCFSSLILKVANHIMGFRLDRVIQWRVTSFVSIVNRCSILHQKPHNL